MTPSGPGQTLTFIPANITTSLNSSLELVGTPTGDPLHHPDDASTPKVLILS